VPATQLICFDCDSTLSAVEGIDELARLRGPGLFAAVERMTRDAMDGSVPLEQVFQRRLELIRPTRAEVEAVGALYVREVEPTARGTIAELRRRGWTPVIVSGGFVPAIAPLARHLGIDRIEAVGLEFDGAGHYAGFDAGHPAARRGGKPEIVARLIAEMGARRSVMVGDGTSDLETVKVVDLFVGFGRYAARPAVKEGAAHFIERLDQLLRLVD
jgi:phosphoserine phosphatase